MTASITEILGSEQKPRQMLHPGASEGKEWRYLEFLAQNYLAGFLNFITEIGCSLSLSDLNLLPISLLNKSKHPVSGL